MLSVSPGVAEESEPRRSTLRLSENIFRIGSPRAEIEGCTIADDCLTAHARFQFTIIQRALYVDERAFWEASQVRRGGRVEGKDRVPQGRVFLSSL